MASSVINIRTDLDTKTKSDILFKELGMTMSSAVNIFLKQCIINDGFPFEISRTPKFDKETIAAIEEAKAIAKDPNYPTYYNTKDLMKALED